MGPTIYGWMRLASIMWPRTDIKSSMCKALTEQVAYDPMAISTFLFTMSLMEGKTYDDAKREVILHLFLCFTIIFDIRIIAIHICSTVYLLVV